jgi:hypothetical protein
VARELERRNFKEISENSFGNTYAKVSSSSSSLIALKGAVIDLQIGTTLGINSPALEVACSPPGIGAKQIQEISETRFCTSYIISDVPLERAGVDLDICNISINCSALEVACPPPGHREKLGNFSAQHCGTYLKRRIREETGGMDLNTGTIESTNSAALEGACGPWPARNWNEKLR